MKSEKVSFHSMDEYIATFPEEIQELLGEIWATIKAAAPDVEEKISYNIPTFTLKGSIEIRSWKGHPAISSRPNITTKIGDQNC